MRALLEGHTKTRGPSRVHRWQETGLNAFLPVCRDKKVPKALPSSGLQIAKPSDSHPACVKCFNRPPDARPAEPSLVEPVEWRVPLKRENAAQVGNPAGRYVPQEAKPVVQEAPAPPPPAPECPRCHKPKTGVWCVACFGPDKRAGKQAASPEPPAAPSQPPAEESVALPDWAKAVQKPAPVPPDQTIKGSEADAILAKRRRMVLEALLKSPIERTSKGIAGMVGLGKIGVSAVIDDLMRRGLVYESDKVKGTPYYRVVKGTTIRDVDRPPSGQAQDASDRGKARENVKAKTPVAPVLEPPAEPAPQPVAAAEPVEPEAPPAPPEPQPVPVLSERPVVTAAVWHFRWRPKGIPGDYALLTAIESPRQSEAERVLREICEGRPIEILSCERRPLSASTEQAAS